MGSFEAENRDESPDDDLLERAGGGSQAAMAEIYERYRDLIINYACRMTGNLNVAEDVFHDTFVYLFEHLDRYEARGHLAGYLFRIAHSMVIDRARADRRAPLSLSGQEDVAPWTFLAQPPSEASEEETRYAAELEQRIRVAVRELPEKLREILVLRAYEGLSYAEIGKMTEVSKATLRSRMRYALQELRKKIRA
ncbi:RNA polymerase sigma factor [Planctomycetota bacterium]